MNKAEFIAQVAQRSGMTKKDAEKAADAVFETIAAVLETGDKLNQIEKKVSRSDHRARITETRMKRAGQQRKKRDSRMKRAGQQQKKRDSRLQRMPQKKQIWQEVQQKRLQKKLKKN